MRKCIATVLAFVVSIPSLARAFVKNLLTFGVDEERRPAIIVVLALAIVVISVFALTIIPHSIGSSQVETIRASTTVSSTDADKLGGNDQAAYALALLIIGVFIMTWRRLRHILPRR